MGVLRFHRALGLALFVFIVNMAATGILRANAKQWYWKDRPSRMPQQELALPQITPGAAIAAAKQRFPELLVTRMTLSTLAGQSAYLLEGKKGERSKVLVDAASGRVIDRLDDQAARDIAAAYVADGTKSLAVEPLPAFVARKGAAPRPAYRIVWDDPERTEVVVDEQAGEVLQVLDRGRRFGLWVNRLHELNFGGLHRIGVTVLGILVIVLGGAGIASSRLARMRNR